jgi:hypothetical protein
MNSRRETSESYRDIIWINQGEGIRIIRCKDNIQFIVQLSKASRWRSRSYSTDVDTIFRDYPALNLPCVAEAIASYTNRRLVLSQHG